MKTLLGSLCCVLVLTFSMSVAAKPVKLSRTFHLFIGTYTNGKSEGIYAMEFDSTTGKLGKARLVAKTVNPSFLAIHPDRRFVYAVNEIAQYKGEKTGSVSAFALDAMSGKLTELNQQSSKGTSPCHIVVDRTGKNVLLANYSSGSATVLPIRKDGSLAAASGVVQHTGSSVDPRRQKGPHAHSINLDASNKFAFVADLGLDKVLIYQFNAEQGKLTPNDPAYVELPPGGGPRHFALHPQEHWAYVNNEMLSSVSTMKYDAKKGALARIQTISTVPKGYKGNNSTAEVLVHPNGKWVYVSNRGHNSIASFVIDQKTGQLTPTGHQGEGIKVPRNFRIDPTGQFLLVANQSGNDVVVFKIDSKTGTLEETGVSSKVPAPICLRFVPVAK